jgi:hypothetical protein
MVFEVLDACEKALRALLAAVRERSGDTTDTTDPTAGDEYANGRCVGTPAPEPGTGETDAALYPLPTPPAAPEAVPCERCARIDAFAGERCEASGCRHDPCGPVEYHDVEGVPLCAECWQECVDEADEAALDSAQKGGGL